jgi:PAS domain S-box-containing protein
MRLSNATSVSHVLLAPMTVSGSGVSKISGLRVTAVSRWARRADRSTERGLRQADDGDTGSAASSMSTSYGRRYPRLAAAIAVATGATVLTGWMFDIAILTQPLPMIASMKANTAVAVVLIGLGLQSLAIGRWSRLTLCLGLVVAVLGTVSLAEELCQCGMGIDELLFLDPRTRPPLFPGRMSPVTAICLMALGSALIVATSRTCARLAQPAALVSALLAAVALAGYSLGIQALVDIGPYSTMALHTAAVLLVVSGGVLFLRPGTGLMAPLMGDHVEARIARRLISAGIVVPVALRWVTLHGQRADLYGPEFGSALMIIASVVVLSIGAWVSARSLAGANKACRHAEEMLRQANAVLARRVDDQVSAVRSSLVERDRFFALSLDLLAVASPNGYFTRVSPSFAETLGHPLEDFTSRSFMDYVHADDVAATLVEVDKLAHGQPTIQFENRYRRKDGGYTWLSWKTVPDAETGLLYCVARDVSAARVAGDQLRASVAEKDMLLREIHHRVKNNLQIMSSLLNLQASAAQDPRLRAALHETRARIHAMALVHETVYHNDNLAAVDFAVFADALWAHLSRMGGTDSRIRFHTDITAPALDIDRAVPCALIVTELVSNAVKHAFAHVSSGTVTVELHGVPNDPARVQLRVSDDGVGWPAEERRQAIARGSIGVKIIGALAQQLQATQVWSGPGTVFTMTFAMNGLESVC